MLKFFTPIQSIGLETAGQEIKVATLEQQKGIPTLLKLEKQSKENFDVNLLYIDHPFLSVALDPNDILIRYLNVPLRKTKDIEAALAFQAEPLIPYPIEEAQIAYQILSQTESESRLLLLITKKEAIQKNLDLWGENQTDPEIIASVQNALGLFAKHYLSPKGSLVIAHVQDSQTVCVLIKDGQLISAYSQSDGLAPLEASRRQGLQSGLEHSDPSALIAEKTSMAESLVKLKKGIAKMSFALIKDLNGEDLNELVLTGEALNTAGIKEFLFESIPVTPRVDELILQPTKEELIYAVPIGLALNGFPNEKEKINFRVGEFAYANPWKRVIKPLGMFFASLLLLAGVIYLFGDYKLQLKQNEIKQNYIDLLASMGKTHEEFEAQYWVKMPGEKERSAGKVFSIQELSTDDLQSRLSYIQKDIHSIPDTFPLFANIPTVSDVLAWLSTHSAVLSTDEKGEKTGRLLLESFNYTLLKRPDQLKKQEKYQVKVDLEFSTAVPMWAREFHDALIAPNDFVDPKGEIKWNSNRGKYKTSFFLKDKTSYL